MKYLHSVVKHKRVGASILLKPSQLPARVSKYAQVVYDLVSQGSQMTPDIVQMKLTEAVGDTNASMFMESVEMSTTTQGQLREIHDYLMTQHIKTSSRAKLTMFLDNMENPEVLDNILEELRDLKSMQPSKSVHLGSQAANAVREAFNGDKSLIKYGYPTIDKRLGGATRGEILLIAARPSHGKTSLAVQFLLNWSKMGYKVVFFSLEMPTSRLIQKMLSNMSKVSGYKIRTGNLDDAEKDRLTKTAEDLVLRFKDTLLIYDDVYTTRQMETIVAKHRPDIVLIDFIQLIDGAQGAMRTYEIGNSMKHLKRMAKEYDAAAVALSQLSRNIESREDPVPRLSDLSESGSLEQLAGDVMFIWYAHKMDNTEPADMVDLYWQKTRYGESSHFKMRFDGSTMTYTEYRAGMGAANVG